jgi:hypothetical protein
VFAFTTLYNFIRLHSGKLDIFEESNSNGKEEDKVDNPLDENTIYIETEIDKLQELIATNM